ncbi:uncharacterized protein [Spinacia oleracea]|uniref:Uncharacterized protein isoform X2 n=1 Tax=Spinacia oleracea TaxID=3562 RepID=A0ABM3RU05_SPIOL|nr:uncharacterized protein LOC110799314 isoform X2 [Spinacia oleracea]
MATYNLEESPDVFITPHFYDNEFQYRMVSISGEDDRKVIRSIDLRSDKLIIYGTEIKQSLFKRLYDSLIIRPKAGILYVNCEGACYFLISGKGCHRPNQNLIFDWSPFGVTIPNSVNDSLKKQLQEKDKVISVLNHQYSLIEVEMLSTKDDLKGSMEQVEKLKEQVSSCKKVQNEMGVKIHEAYERVALVDFELELYKIELNSYKKGEEELLDQICSCKEGCRKLELELEKRHAQLSSAYTELQCTKVDLETSAKSIKELGFQLSSCMKESQDMETKLKRVEEEHSLISLELRSTKNELELSNKNVKYLEEIIATYKKESKNMEVELQNIQNEIKDECYSHMIEQQFVEGELQKVINHLSIISYEVMSTNQKLDDLLISKLLGKVNGYDHSEAIIIQCRPNSGFNSSSIQQGEDRDEQLMHQLQ